MVRLYREVVSDGEIPASSFILQLIGRRGISTQAIEDLETERTFPPIL